MNNNVIIGTAGHIDHGKTTLIKALSGIETDTTQEEKDRGMSINLGFAYFDLPSGKDVELSMFLAMRGLLKICLLELVV